METIRHSLARRGYYVRQMLGPLAEAFDYCCVEEYVAEHGIYFSLDKPLVNGALMKPGRCFNNSLRVSTWSNGQLAYVEGFSGRELLRHAWVHDPNANKTYDPTWEHDPNRPYIGCLFPEVLHAVIAWRNHPLYHPMRKLLEGLDRYTPATAFVLLARRGTPLNYGPWIPEWLKDQKLSFKVA